MREKIETGSGKQPRITNMKKLSRILLIVLIAIAIVCLFVFRRTTKTYAAPQIVKSLQFGTSLEDSVVDIILAGDGYITDLIKGDDKSHCAKIDSDFKQIWDWSCLGARASICEPIIDNDGNIHLFGQTWEDISSNSNGISIILSQSGKEKSAFQVISSGFDFLKSGIMLSDNSVIAIGYTMGDVVNNTHTENNSLDFFVCRYDNQVNQVWIKQQGTADNDDEANAICNSINQTFVIGGYTSDLFLTPGAPDMQFDAFLECFDYDGNVIWAKRFGSDRIDEVKSIACDNMGNIYVVGIWNSWDDTADRERHCECFIAKFDSNGNQLWLNQVSNPNTYVHDCQMVLGGNSFYLLYNYQNDGNYVSDEQSSGRYIIKYDSDGNELYSLLLTPEQGYDGITDMIVNNVGNLVITGFTNSSLFCSNLGGSDSFIAEYAVASKPTFSVAGGHNNNSRSVSVTSSISGSDIRYTLNGSEPTISSRIYTVPLAIDSNVTLKARVWKDGYFPSDVNKYQNK